MVSTHLTSLTVPPEQSEVRKNGQVQKGQFWCQLLHFKVSRLAISLFTCDLGDNGIGNDSSRTALTIQSEAEPPTNLDFGLNKGVDISDNLLQIDLK